MRRGRWRRALLGLFVLVSGEVAPTAAGATVHALTRAMTGLQEVPADTSTASGSCTASVDDSTLTVTFDGSFAGLQSPASAVTLHGLAGPGVVAPVLLQAAFPAATSGTFSGSGSLSATDVAGMLGGKSYCEIADGAFPTGEIRGQLTPTTPTSTPALPPGAAVALLLLLGGTGAWATAKRNRVSA